MKRNQLVLVVLAIVLLLAVYVFAPTKKPVAKDKDVAAAEPDMQSKATAEVLDIESYIASVKQQVSDKTTQNAVLEAEQKQDFNRLIELYKQQDKPLAVAYYAYRNAMQQQTLPDLLKAGDYNSMLAQTAPDQASKSFLLTNAAHLYELASKTDTTNQDVKLRLASVYIEEGSQPMRGVSMLLEMVRRDSTNAEAQLLLGRFGIISGQIDKAIVRLEKVLYLRPQNSEALFLLAEAHNAKGNTSKALELLEQCKKTMKSDELRKEIDNYIKNIQQKTAK